MKDEEGPKSPGQWDEDTGSPDSSSEYQDGRWNPADSLGCREQRVRRATEVNTVSDWW